MFDDAAEYETASIASDSTVSTIMTTNDVAHDVAVAEFEFEHPGTVVLKCFEDRYESSYYLGHRGGYSIHPVTAHMLIENLPFTDPTHELQETTPSPEDEDPWQQQQQLAVSGSARPESFLNGPDAMSRGDALPTTFKTTTALNNKRPSAYSVYAPAAAKRAHVSEDPSAQQEQGEGEGQQGQSIQASKPTYSNSAPNPLQPRSDQRKMDEGCGRRVTPNLPL